MLPPFSAPYVPCMTVGNAKMIRDFFACSARSESPFHNDHFVIRKNGIGAAFPASVGPVSDSISGIPLTGIPSQVIGDIITRISIVMTGFMLWCGTLPVKRMAHQRGNVDSLMATVLHQFHVQVTFQIPRWAQQSSSGEYHHWLSCLGVWRISRVSSPYSTEITEFIIWPVFQETPFFYRKIISHVARSFRAIGQRWQPAPRGLFTSFLCQKLCMGATT